MENIGGHANTIWAYMANSNLVESARRWEVAERGWKRSDALKCNLCENSILQKNIS